MKMKTSIKTGPPYYRRNAGGFRARRSGQAGTNKQAGPMLRWVRGVVVCLAMVASLPLACSSEKPSSDDRQIVVFERAAQVPPGLQNLTSSPTPAVRGPFYVCQHRYNFEGSGVTRFGVFYVPALTNTRDGRCITHGTFPLLIIAHADGDHGGYTELATHLASNAIIVASVNRMGVSVEDFEALLTDHIDYIYGSSAIKDFVKNDIALLGHSAGGRSVIRHAGVIHLGNLPVLGEPTDKELKAVILLASTVEINLEKTFEGETPALMGINITIDSDVSAFGNKVPGEVMQSTFRIYDEAGLIEGQPNILSLEKDMIFVNGGVGPGISSHYFQNTLFARGYINAFLQLHLRGHGTFGRFFKHQEKIPMVATQVFQQHAERTQLLVANFENGSADEHVLGGSIQVMGNHIENLVVGEAHQLDEFSPHHTMVMRFDWSPDSGGLVPPGAPGPGGPDWIRFRFDDADPAILAPGPQNLLPYRYVALRITQVYDPTTNPEGTPRDFSVRLHTQGGDASVPVSLHGGELHFPLVVSQTPTGVAQEEQTKNAMRSYLIPLRAFVGIDLSAVDEVVLDFSDAGEEPTVFLLDDVAFWF